jgi:hypothetical protein
VAALERHSGIQHEAIAPADAADLGIAAKSAADLGYTGRDADKQPMTNERLVRGRSPNKMVARALRK